MSKRIRVFLRASMVLALAVVSTTAFGATVTWDGGGGDEKWSTPTNWSTDSVPTGSDDAIIAFVGTGTVTIDVNAAVNSFSVQSGAVLWLQENLTLTVNDASTVDFGGSMNLQEGSTFSGSGDLTVDGVFHIFGGTLDGSGNLTITANGYVRLWAAINTSGIARTTTNNGNLDFLDAGPGSDFVFSGSQLANYGSIGILTDHVIGPGLGSPLLSNNSGGAIKKVAGSGTATIDFQINNGSGATIEVWSGTLELTAGGAVNGAYTISSGATLSFAGGTFTTSGSPAITGPGNFSIAPGATLAVNGGTLTMSGNPAVSGSVSIGGGTLNAGPGVDVTWTDVSLSAGTITGTGAVHVSGNFIWSGGTISGGGQRVLDSTSTPAISCSTAACALNGATLRLQASGTYSASANALELSNGASLTLDAGKVLNVTNDGDFSNGGGTASSITNNGTIWKTTTSGTSVIGVPVTMAGAFDVDTGTLQLSGGVTVNSGAIVDYAPGATIEVNGGVFLFNSSSVSFPLTGNFKVSAGTLRVPTSISITIPNLTLQSSGVIDGGGTLILSGAPLWSAGTMGSATAPGGITQINSGTTFDITVTGTTTLSQNRVLLNNGTLNLPSAAVIDRSGFATIQNNGTIAKSAGAGTTTVHPTVENNSGGTVSVAAGTLALSAGGTADGAYSISSGATLTLGGGTFTMATTGTITGAGTLSIVSSGTLSASTGVDVTIPNLTLALGTITGTGTVRVSGNFTWSGGTITGSGARVLNSTAVPTISCSAGNCALDGAALQFQAWATYSASSNSLVLSNGASLILDAGQVLFVTNDGDFLNGGGAASSIVVGGLSAGVNGCIEKMTTAGTSIIGVPVTLSGSFRTDSGTLQLAAGVTAAAGAIVWYSAATTIEVTGGVFLFNSGAISFPASGTFKVSGGTMRVPTSISLTMPNVTLQSSGTIDGGGTLILSGTSTWSGGTMGSATAPGGITEIDSGATMNVTGTRLLTQSRILRNNGTLNLPATGGIIGSGSPKIENNGTIARNSGAGSISIVPRLENNSGGTVSIATGTVALLGGGIAAGAFAISSGATLSLSGTGTTFTVASTATVTGAGTLSIAAGTFDAGAGVDLTCPNVTLSGGTITGVGTLRVSGNFTWSGGTIAGSGPRILNSTSTPAITCSPADCTLDGAALQLQASTTFSASAPASFLVFSNGASLIIDAGKTFAITNDGGILGAGAGPGSITNNGTISKTTTAGLGGISVPVTMSATSTVDVDSGTLAFSTGVTVAAGATIDIAAAATLQADGGVFLFNSGPVSMPGSGTFRITAFGTARIPAGVTMTIPNLTLQAGTIDGGGTLVLSGTSTWSGGTMGSMAAPGGITRIDSGNTLNITAASGISLSQGRELLNNGTVNHGGTSALTLSGASQITNNAAFNLTANGTINVSGSGTITNNGTLAKSGGTGTSTIVPAVNSTGTVSATTGTLSLTGAGTHANVVATAPATIAFQSGTHSLGNITGTGTIAFSGATATVSNPFTIGALSVTGGIATLDGNGSADAFSMTGGTIGGSGTLTLTNGGTWSGGTMSGGGPTINPAAKTLTISAPVTLDSRTLQNDGTLSVSGNVTGSGTIANNGTLNAAGNVIIGAALSNSGQVATNASLSLSGGGTHSGSFTVTAPGNLAFASGTHSVTGGSIAGTGTLTFSGATTTIDVPVTAGALNVTSGTATLNAAAAVDGFNMNGGTIGGTGTLTLNDGGTWSGGTMTGSGQTVNPATKTLTISAPVTLDGRTLQNDGTMSVSGDVAGSGTIANNGTLDAIGNITIGAALNNGGQVATSALLFLAGGGTHTGSFNVTAPGNLAFSAGSHSMSGGGSIAGTGTLTFSGAAATIGVPVSAGALNMTAGAATFNAGAAVDGFSMNGGTLGGTGTLTLNDGGTWSGGTMSGSGQTVNAATKTLTISGPVTLNGRTLQNAGTLSVSANVTGSGTIANNGTLNALGDVAIATALSNSGQIATSAVLALGGSGAHAGTFTINAPGAIDFSGGTQTVSGTLAGTGTLRFSGAAVTVGGTWSGMPVEVSGGSVALDTNGTMSALTLSGGSLAGSGDVTVTGPSTWSGGSLAGSAPITFDSGVTLAMPGTDAVTLARPLLNQGTIDFAASSNGMLIAGVAVTNDGTFNILSSQAITATAGTPPFVNRGTLAKSGASGVMQFGAPLVNSGAVRIESGTMHFGQSYAQSAGTTTIRSGATLRAAELSLDGGSLTGNGTVVGTVANGATVSPGASPGTLTINGDYVQSSGGVLAMEIAGTQYDRLVVSGSITLDGTLDVTTASGFTPAPGSAFQILTFGSRAGNSTFAAMNGLNASGTVLVPVFSATALQLTTNNLPVADVAVDVSGPVSTIAGSNAIYTITVSNSGPDTATNIAVTATASPGLTFSANSGACAGSFPCTIGALGPGQQATIHSAWTIASSATDGVQLTVVASAATDANASNDSATAITNIGTCPAITILAPDEMTTGATAQAIVTSFGEAVYSWSIVNGTIDSDNGVGGIAFTAGTVGTTRLTVSVTGGGCALVASFEVTVKPLLTCIGTATPAAPADGTIADAVVDFSWDAIAGASGYRLWLEQDGAPPQSLGTTLDTSRTEILLPGVYRWYVETLFDGCASRESQRLALTILAAKDCDTRGAPQLSAPANESAAPSAAVAFSWNAVDKALEYELWLAPAGGVPTLIHAASDTSYTAVVPPGRLEWYVRAIFAGCAATESVHRTFTYTPPPECSSERPLLIAPVEGERLTSPVSFEWTSVSGATSYELYVDGVLAATTTSPQVSGLSVPLTERRWQVRARLGEGCGAVDSAESRIVVIPSPPSCAPLAAPVISAPGQISSGIPGRIQWSFVPGATAYVVEISSDPRFTRESTSASAVAARQLPFTFTNQGSAPVPRYVRVHAIDTNCVEPRTGAFSPVAVLFVLPPTGSEGAALLTDPTEVRYTLSIGADRAGQSFTATPTVPWVSVTPASGIVPPGGQTLRAVARTFGLPPGTSIGSVEITTTDAAGALTALGTLPPFTLPIPVNNIPGVSTSPKSTPPPDALVIPAVAKVTNFIVSYSSDVCVTNTSAQVMKYEIDFVPTGEAGMSEGQKTNVSLEPGATMAINDIVSTWFGGRTSSGTLEVRPVTEVDTSTSSAPVGGLANRTTFASSRTFSTTAGGGTYGQYIPAVPYANFVARGSILSLQQIAESDKYRTNLGLVEGSGEQVTLEVRIFDAAGTKRAAFNVDLKGGERAQLDGVLKEHGVALDDGRIEVEVTSGDGKVTAYAAVIDKNTNDSQLVPALTLDDAGHSKWVVPGVADLVSSSGNWQTDVRLFNGGTETVDLTLEFYSMNGGPAATRTISLAAGEVRQLDRVLSFFGISGDAGALHVSSAAPAQVVATARTYKQTGDGAYGQFIAAATPDEAVAAGSRPLQILQMEESVRFKSNIGFAEVSGKPVTLEVAAFRPNSKAPAVLEVKLAPNQFVQLNSLLSSLGLGETYNARISVRAVAGEGRALAYGSLIDHKTGDPTYIPGQ